MSAEEYWIMIKKDGGTQTDHYKGDAFDRQLFFFHRKAVIFLHLEK